MFVKNSFEKFMASLLCFHRTNFLSLFYTVLFASHSSPQNPLKNIIQKIESRCNYL